MPKLIYAEQFIEDMTGVRPESKRDEISSAIDLLSPPELGSRNLPNSIQLKYGKNVRKFVIDPFDIIYEYLPEANEVHVLALVPQRAPC